MTFEDMGSQNLPARLADAQAGEWQMHARFPGVLMKGLLTSADNALASVNVVRVPPGCEISRHRHATQVETIFALAGQGMFWLGDSEVPFRAGQIVAVPMNTVHGLRNTLDQDIELLTVFTPPLR
jgi:quercetin dioxygenase-like cupin family protein